MAHPLRSDPSSLPARDKGNGYGVGRATLPAQLIVRGIESAVALRPAPSSRPPLRTVSAPAIADAGCRGVRADSFSTPVRVAPLAGRGA